MVQRIRWYTDSHGKQLLRRRLTSTLDSFNQNSLGGTFGWKSTHHPPAKGLAEAREDRNPPCDLVGANGVDGSAGSCQETGRRSTTTASEARGTRRGDLAPEGRACAERSPVMPRNSIRPSSMPGFGDRGMESVSLGSERSDRRVRSGTDRVQRMDRQAANTAATGTSGDLLNTVSKTDRQAATRYL